MLCNHFNILIVYKILKDWNFFLYCFCVFYEWVEYSGGGGLCKLYSFLKYSINMVNDDDNIGLILFVLVLVGVVAVVGKQYS